MKLVEVSMEIPCVLKEIDEKLFLLFKDHRDFKISGGCLSNLYMNKEMNDIDVFVNYDPGAHMILKIFGDDTDVETKPVSDRYGEVFQAPYLYRFSYKGYKVEMIITNQHRIFEFDFRFRNFFLTNGKVFADAETLKDINEKKLVITNPHTPISTLFRLFRFQEEFGFSVDEKSFRFLKWYTNRKLITKEYLNRYIQERKEKINKKALAELYSFIELHTVDENGIEVLRFKDVDFPFHHSLEEVVFNELNNDLDNCFSLYYENLCSFSFTPITFDVEVDDQFFSKKFQNIHQKIKSSRLLTVLEDCPYSLPDIKDRELVNRWREYLDSDDVSGFFSEYQYSEDDWFLFIMSDSLPEKLIFSTYIPNRLPESVSLGDVLTGHLLFLNVSDRYYFFLRKCTNGKYTIAGIYDRNSEFYGLYLEYIGYELVKKMPELFDFYNDQLEAYFSYPFHFNYFFPYYTGEQCFDIFEHLSSTITKKIDIIIKE